MSNKVLRGTSTFPLRLEREKESDAPLLALRLELHAAAHRPRHSGGKARSRQVGVPPHHNILVGQEWRYCKKLTH